MLLEKEDEMDCLVGGANFLLKAIHHEAFMYENSQTVFTPSNCEPLASCIVSLGQLSFPVVALAAMSSPDHPFSGTIAPLNFHGPAALACAHRRPSVLWRYRSHISAHVRCRVLCEIMTRARARRWCVACSGLGPVPLPAGEHRLRREHAQGLRGWQLREGVGVLPGRGDLLGPVPPDDQVPGL